MSTTDSPHFKKLYRDFVPILGQIFSTESLTLVCAMLAEESLEARKALAPFDPSTAPEIVRHEFRKRGTSDAWNECSELIYKFYQCQANDAGYEVRALAVVPAPPEERK